MATNIDYIEYVCDQLKKIGEIRYKKMFGEYMVYVNNKPLITVCNNISYVKEKEEIASLMNKASKGFPYEGAKEHYILDIDDADFACEVISLLESVTPLPKPKKKKTT